MTIASLASKKGAPASGKKKINVVRVADGFSDSETSSQETPTSPAPRSSAQRSTLAKKGLAPPASSNVDPPTGGNASATATASAERLQEAASETFGTDGVIALLSPLRQREGKAPMVDIPTSDVTLTVPQFISADFETRPEIIPFVEGVSQIVSPLSGPSPFTELNEFSEGCSAVKSLLVRVGIYLASSLLCAIVFFVLFCL